MKLLDRLEEDYQDVFPDEAPPIEGVFEDALLRLVLQK